MITSSLNPKARPFFFQILSITYFNYPPQCTQYIELRHFATELCPDIIAVSETWLSKSIPTGPITGAMSQETGLEVPRYWPQYKRMFLVRAIYIDIDVDSVVDGLS